MPSTLRHEGAEEEGEALINFEKEVGLDQFQGTGPVLLETAGRYEGSWTSLPTAAQGGERPRALSASICVDLFQNEEVSVPEGESRGEGRCAAGGSVRAPRVT